MLKLICGLSGSDKTEQIKKCIEADVRAGVRSFLLIPEQQAYISERDLAEKLPKNAGSFFEVVSFSGLAEKVFCKYGGVTVESVSGAVSSLLMCRLNLMMASHPNDWDGWCLRHLNEAGKWQPGCQVTFAPPK